MALWLQNPMATSRTMSPPNRPTGIALATALGFLLPGAVAMGQVANGPPTADDFQILYFTVDYDEDGEPRRRRQMTQTDLDGTFANLARCECGQEILARIVLKPGSYPADSIRTYVGNRCDEAQGTPNLQTRPCVKIYDALPQAYRNGANLYFHPIWLARGIDGTQQDVSNATAHGTCAGGRGDAGVWICAESNGQPDCQADEFIIKGDRNENVQDGGSAALSYSLDPPLALPSNVHVESGDQAIIARWTHEAPDPAGGFRVLCSDANGNPVPGKGFSLNSITGINLGTTYFTEGNLCPDGPFTEVRQRELDPGELPPDPDPEPDTGDTDTDGDRDPTAGFDGWPDPVSYMTTGGTDEGFTGTTGDTGTTGGTSTGTGTGTGDTETSTGGEATASAAAVSALESLDWAYSCTDHLPFNTNSARISGLENGQQYHFLLVAYNRAGNPIAASEVMTGVPRDTIDLWEQCEIHGEVCGDGGYCACSTETVRPLGALMSLLGLLFGAGGVLYRRRRRLR